MTPRTVLITGASAGIGKCFAEFYAAKGYDLILTARRTDRLAELATQLSSVHGIKCETISADLADTAAPDAIWAELTARGLTVDVLINNAGYGMTHHFTDYDWWGHRDFIQIMVTAYAQLCHLALPGMKDRKYGRIINVASLAGLAPGTLGHTLYGASKAFLIKMSESLSLENEGTGVHVTALNPGFTRSEFHTTAGVQETVDRMPEWMWMQAPDVVAEAFEASEKGLAQCVPGRANKFTAVVLRLFPPRLALMLSRRRAAAQDT
ncbi:MAG: SDR family NAD(P)-dependent oxidoreductase [Candidatus Phaeomarinobacter sp.]